MLATTDHLLLSLFSSLLSPLQGRAGAGDAPGAGSDGAARGNLPLWMGRGLCRESSYEYILHTGDALGTGSDGAARGNLPLWMGRVSFCESHLLVVTSSYVTIK
jgi:hypothetical protein